MNNIITSICLFLAVNCAAVTYTTTGVDTWDGAGEPPAGWLGAGTIINVNHAVTKGAYTVQLNGTATININSGGNWNITSMQTNSTGWVVNVNSGGTFELTSSITTSSGGGITVSSGANLITGSTANIVSGSSLTVDGIMTVGSSIIIGATAVVDVDGFMDVTTSYTNAAAITGSGYISYATDGLGGGSFTGSLPVDLIYFDLKNSNELVWQTASETNNDYFQVQRSKNGVEYETIAEVSGAGNSSEVLTYSYEVENGKYYYRLIQVDYDGAQEISHAITSEGPEESLEIVQRENSGDFYVLFKDDQLQELEVIDVNGRLIMSRSISTSKNQRLNFSILQSGFYIINLRSGSSLTSKKTYIR